MREQRVLEVATIAPNAVRYQMWVLAIGLSSLIIAIPLLPVLLPIGAWYWRRYYAHLSVRLTTRELNVSRGVLIREEKSIPLEKITDIAVVEGPIMRWLGVKGIRVETAGQSSTGALVSIVGIEGVDAFRDSVLDQRDLIAKEEDEIEPSLPATRPARDPEQALLGAVQEIRDTLARIESRISPPP
jgi:putative membrane protein